MRRLFTAFFLVLMVVGSFGMAAAQTVPVPSKGAPAPVVMGLDISKEAYVIEHYSTKVIFDADGKGQRETTATIKMLADAGVKTFAVMSFAYTSANESVDFPYVRVRKADGTVVNTPDYNVQDMPADVTRTAPMYSDIHEKHVAVKGLGVGDVLEYSVRYSITKPQVPGQFWYEHTFLKQEIVKDERLEICVPGNKHVTVVAPGYKPEINDEGAEKVYRWTSSNLARKEREGAEDEEEKKPSVQLTTFANWEEIGKWYGELQRESVTVTPAIQAKAAELTKGLNSDEEKIRAIYNFVSLRIHYVGLSFGIGRYQPHAAEDTLGNEYGDCKDKHTLLATLLKAAGYDVWPVLINASRKIDEDVPSVGQFNHVITAVPQGEKIVWLDTTAEVAPFGLILPNLRNKKALVIPTAKAPYLTTTPQNPPFPQKQLFVAEGKLSSDGTLTAHMEQDITGDAEVVLRTVYRQVPQAQWKELAQRISYGAGFAGDVSDVKVSAPEDLSKKLHISYEYTRKKYSDWENGRILPPLPPVGIEYQDPDKKKPKEPVFLGMPGELVYKSRIQLPEGCSLRLPKNLDLVESYAEYHTTNTVENGLYSVEHRFVLKKSEIALAEWENYKKFRKAVADDKLTFVPMDGANLIAKMVEGSDDPTILFRMALTSTELRDYAGAQRLYERVIEKDPKYENAHRNLALVLMTQNKYSEALDEVRKEEEISPKDWEAYDLAATLLKQMHREDEAVGEYQKLLQADPRNLRAAQKVCAMLLDQHKFSQATEMVETTLKGLPDSSILQLMLGTALLKNAQTENGVAYLRKAVEANNGSTKREVLNDAAYSLAESKVELELAKTWAQKAVSMVEADSVKQASEDDFGIAKELAAAWDTLGWTYFQLGEYREAEPYLRASWVLTQSASAGYHLGQTYERLGKIALAKQTYLYGLSAERYRFSSPEEGTAYVAGVDRCRVRYEKLAGRAPSSEIKRLPNGEWSLTPKEELQRMRTVKLANTAGVGGKAEFSIVFAPGKIEAVRCLGGEEEVRGLASKIQAAKLPAEFPPQSTAKIVRRAMLKCSRTGCELELKPPSDTYLMEQSMGEF